MKHVNKLLLVPMTLGVISSISMINAQAESIPNVAVEQYSEAALSPISSNGIVVGENNSDTTVTENYLTLENPLDDMLKAAPKTIKVNGSMIFDKQGWAYGPPKSRNWKEKRHGYWYYGKLYLQSYKSAGNNWIAQYSGTLTRK